MTKHHVLIYTSSNSPECDRLVESLKAWGVEYTEKNVSVNSEYLKEIQRKGIFGTPVTFIDENHILGYQEIKLKFELGISNNQGSYFRNVYDGYKK